MSAALIVFLREARIPAVAVTGNLTVDGVVAFRQRESLPANPNRLGSISFSTDLHCWVQIGSLIVDLSLASTSAILAPENPIRRAVESKFGPAGTVIVFDAKSPLAKRFDYEPKDVLQDDQIECFAAPFFKG